MNASHVLYWIWLSTCVSPGSKASDVLLERFGGSAKAIYEAKDEEFDALDLSEDVKARLKLRDSAEAKQIYYRCKESGITLLPYDDERFPSRLRTIGHRPVLLYCKGKIPDFDRELLIAAVGTRRMTSYGKRSAYEISFDLSCAGAIIVSGLALGVDAVCHRGALDAHGFTVAVLGCGVDITYPKENFELQLEIEKKGLIISEYKPGTRPSKTTFPIRNRLISGLSQGTFVIEGDKRSGALITARCAQAQGRRIFSLPGMVGERSSEGTNELLRDGAVPVTCAFDVLDEFAGLYPDRIFPERVPVFRPKTVVTPVPNEKRRSPVNASQARAESASSSDEAPALSGDASPRPGKRRTRSAAERSSLPDAAPDAVPEDELIPNSERAVPPGLTPTEEKIFRVLDLAQEPLTADEICERADLGAGEVMTSLTLLEISGSVLSLPGGRFLID